MKLKRILQFTALAPLLTLAAIVSGRCDWWDPPPVHDSAPFVFAEDFENASTLADLFPKDTSRWHGRQLIPEDNVVELTGETAHSGRRSLKCHAAATRGGITSKADLERGGLHFVKGDHIWSQCWLLLQGEGDGASVFVWDLEASRKWQSPGRRLYLQPGGVLASDLGKWLFAPTFRQPWDHGAPFPKDRWVRLKVYLFLSEQADGAMEVWQDDTKVLDGHGQTLPTAKSVYDRLQVGLTANGNPEHAYTLYVDDVIISNRPIP